MSKVKIQGHASGTGVLTVTAPNTSTDRTITLPDSTGTLLTADGDGSSLTGVGVDGISSSADATAITITSAERIGINHTTPDARLEIEGGNETALKVKSTVASEYPAIFQSASTGTVPIADFRDNGGNSIMKVMSAGGITFGTDTAAANALDDYEEGTWTPGFNGATVSGNNGVGFYTKIGNMVYVTYYTGTISISNQSGAAQITGLPFTVLSDSSQYSTFYYSHGTAVADSVGGHFTTGQTKMGFVVYNATANAPWVNGTRYAMVSGIYLTTA